MSSQLPSIPSELKAVFVIYLKEFKDNLEVFSPKKSNETFVFSEQEQKNFQQRFHRLKGSSGFFQFKELAELAKEGEQLFTSIPASQNLPHYQRIVDSLTRHLEEIEALK